MAVPYLPLGISAAVLGGILLFAPRSEAAEPLGIPNNGGGGGGGGGGAVPVNPGRWPAGTAVAIVAVDPNDPGLQGRQPGVRVRSQPTANSTLVSTGIANGERVKVLSAETTDSEGRKWRQIQTLGGLTGYAPFVGPDGKLNMTKAPESAPWPGGGEPAVAGVPSPFARVAGHPALLAPFARVGACGDPRYAAYGYAPWGSAYANGAIRVDAIGQQPLAPGSTAQCVRECQLYVPFERGVGWTVKTRLRPGTLVYPVTLPGGFGTPRGPSADYVFVNTAAGAGWIHRAQLAAVRTLGRRRRPAPLPMPVLR